MVAFVLLIGILCVKYYRYAYIVTSHCMHGDFAEIAGYRVRLPYLWWKGDSQTRDKYLLLRACPSNTFSRPELEVNPSIPGDVMDTDQEELKSTQAMISGLNYNGIEGWSHSLVTLTSRPFTLYCIRGDETIFGTKVFSNLTCFAAKLPYWFNYSGPPAYEKEAESILSSLE